MRQHLRVIEQAVYRGWEIPEEAFATIPIDLLSIAQDEEVSPRDRIRASEALAHLQSQRVDAAIQLDRIVRLENGEATDRVQLMEGLTDEQLKAVAATIMPQANPECPKPKPRKRPR
jgi:hypothetical protein